MCKSPNGLSKLNKHYLQRWAIAQENEIQSTCYIDKHAHSLCACAELILQQCKTLTVAK